MLRDRMTPYELELLESADPGVLRVALAGELDLTNAADLERRVEELAPPEAVLVLDLQRVTFVDSAVLHVLFQLASRHGTGRLAVVVVPDGPIARTLEIVALAESARVVASEDELRPSRTS
jgi:anti-anti-sigma factor